MCGMFRVQSGVHVQELYMMQMSLDERTLQIFWNAGDLVLYSLNFSVNVS